MLAANTLAYCYAATIAAVKSCIVKALKKNIKEQSRAEQNRTEQNCFRMAIAPSKTEGESAGAD